MIAFEKCNRILDLPGQIEKISITHIKIETRILV